MQTKRVVFRHRFMPYVFVLPQLIITFIFFLWPAAQAIFQSVLQENAFGTSTTFVGLENFRDLLQDSVYLSSFKTTLIFSAATALLAMATALVLAVVADRVIRGTHTYRTFLIWPYAVAPAVSGVLWWFLFNPTLGIAAYVLRQVGVDWDPATFGTQAMVLVIIAAAWKQVSYNFLFFLAGLQSIPHSLIEAAAIDGAGPVKRFWTVVVPLLTPTVFFLGVINLVYAFFDTFAVIDATTQGGPGTDTTILVYKVWRDGFIGQDLGGSAAQSVVLMVIAILLTVVQFRYVERHVNY